MTSICPVSSQAFTSDELSRAYTGRSVMPLTLPSDNDRTANAAKLLTDSFLSNHLRALKGAGIIPAPPAIGKIKGKSPNDMIQEFVQKVDELKKIIQDEYCYYFARYRYALSTVFNRISQMTAQGTTQGNMDAQTEMMLNKAVALNRRLQDLSQIANAITQDQYATTKEFQSQINSANAEIQSYFSKLQEQAAILRKEVPQVEINKRMASYTKEKANYNKNLLSLYFFLDVVALGILFYVYKAT